MKKIRNVPGQVVQDPSIIHNLEYNNAAGSKKVSEVGRHLIPLKYINAGVLTYTTDASTARALDNSGACLAIYNSSGSVETVTLGESSAVVSLAAGVTDAAGHVGIPCVSENWTYVACGNSNWVITSSNNLLVFVIDDDSSIQTEVK